MVFITPPRNHGGVIDSLQFVSLSLSVCVCVCVCVCLSVCHSKKKKKTKPNGCTDSDPVFAE